MLKHLGLHVKNDLLGHVLGLVAHPLQFSDGRKYVERLLRIVGVTPYICSYLAARADVNIVQDLVLAEDASRARTVLFAKGGQHVPDHIMRFFEHFHHARTWSRLRSWGCCLN